MLKLEDHFRSQNFSVIPLLWGECKDDMEFGFKLRNNSKFGELSPFFSVF